jgi:hypothetical protein
MTPAKLFADCTPQDFQHYFANTLFRWRLTPTKSRIYWVSNLDGRVIGHYLNKEKVLRSKSLDWKTWWEDLFILPHKMRMFNFSDGVGIWSPTMHKNLRKSLRFDDPKPVTLLGKVPSSEQSTQGLLFRAFPELYPNSDLPNHYTIAEALESSRSATVCDGGLILDKSKKRFYHKNTVVAWLEKGKIDVAKNASHLIPLFVNNGIPAEDVRLSEAETKPLAAKGGVGNVAVEPIFDSYISDEEGLL